VRRKFLTTRQRRRNGLQNGFHQQPINGSKNGLLQGSSSAARRTWRFIFDLGAGHNATAYRWPRRFRQRSRTHRDACSSNFALRSFYHCSPSSFAQTPVGDAIVRKRRMLCVPQNALPISALKRWGAKLAKVAVSSVQWPRRAIDASGAGNRASLIFASMNQLVSPSRTCSKPSNRSVVRI
jgi:hypothetical protein